LKDIFDGIVSKQEIVGEHLFEYVIRNDDAFFIEHLKEAKRTIENDYIGKCINDTPDYKREVFDLLLAVQLPGIESIEVNESQKKFVAHYKHDEPISDDKNAYTLDKLKTLWQAYLWQLVHHLPDFRIEDFIEFVEKPKEIFYLSEGLIDHIMYKDGPDDTYKKDKEVKP
jgi:hypothetical protein